MLSFLLSKTALSLFLLLILPYSIADDSSSFTPQEGLASPIFPSDGPLQSVPDRQFNPDSLLAGSEDSAVGCGNSAPGDQIPTSSRMRRSRFSRRQKSFCTWQEFKTGNQEAGTPQAPIKIGPDDVTPAPDKGKLPITTFLGITESGLCGTSKESIPVCHYNYIDRGSLRSSSPLMMLSPCRACGLLFPSPKVSKKIYMIDFGSFDFADQLSQICMGLEELWCCSSIYPRPQDSLANDINSQVSETGRQDWR